MSLASSELEGILAERLELVRKEKAELRESIEDLEFKLKNSRKALTQAPRETEDELVASMQKLEHKHATTAQTNAEEREFMREMERLRQKRKAVATFTKLKSEVEEMRTRLNELRKAQAEKDDSITELHQGLRKVKIANRIGCTNADITEHKFSVETAKVARIVGKGGSNLRFIESEHNVSIEIDNTGGVVRIMGVDAGINAAYQAIMTIVETSIEEFPLSDEVIVCLMMDKAQRVNDIQAQFAVRLDISRAKNLCKVTGLTENVAAAKAHILSLQSIRSDMLMESSAISAIIGKGGASITALQDEFHVAINVNRERNTVEVVGMRPDVSAALSKIRDIVEDNKEVEEVIQLEKHVLMGCLMAPGGLRTISKDYSVRIDSEVVKDAPLQSIRIKGNNGKVHQAKAHIVQLVGEYISNSLIVEVPDDVIPAILGKAGAGIKALRDKHHGANIDIDGCKVHIQSASAEQRATIKAEIDAVLDANYSELVEFDEEGKIQLRSAKGADVRTQLTKELNVRLIIDGSDTAVKVRGNRSDVVRAVEALEEFKRSHCNEKLELAEEDYPLLLNPRTKGGDDSLAKGFEAQYNVEIVAQRKELRMFLTGSPEGVAAAKAAIHGVLNGDAEYGSQILDLPKLVTPTLIGKGGANIAKMEAELGVKFDVLKSRVQLRLVGDSAEKVIAARHAVLRFIQGCRVTDTATISILVSKKDADAVVRRACEVYQTEITTTGKAGDENADKNGGAKDDSAGTKTFTIKGTYAAVANCMKFLSQELSGRSTFTVPVCPHHLPALEKQVHGSLKRLQDKFAVALQVVSSPECGVRLEGAAQAVNDARHEVVKLLERYFPSEVTVISVPASCLRESFGEDFVAQMTGLGVVVSVDRASGSLLLVGEQERLETAREEVATRKEQWEDCHATLTIDPSIAPSLVGKGGASINALRKETQVNIDISPNGNTVEIKGSSRELVVAAKAALEKRIKQLHAERWETTAPTECMPALIGKQGANINKLRADTGAGIDIEGSTIKVYGSEEKVAAAKAAILEILGEAQARQAGSKTLVVPAASIPAIIGAKGATVRELQEATGVRFDFDRASNKCALKGSVEGVEKALRLVNELLAKEGFPDAVIDGQQVAAAANKAGSGEKAEDSEGSDKSEEIVEKAPLRGKVPVGAPPSMVQKVVVDKSLSKSAQKRMRRKLAQENATAREDAAAEEDETEPTTGGFVDAPSPAPAAPSTAAQPTQAVSFVPSPPTGPVRMHVDVAEPAAEPAQDIAHSVPAPAVNAAPVGAVPPKLGVIGKSPRLAAADVDSFRASHFSQPAASAPASAPVSTPSLPSSSVTNPQMLQQQQLIDLLLGNAPAPAAAAFKLPSQLSVPAVQQTHQPSRSSQPVYQPPAQYQSSAYQLPSQQYDTSVYSAYGSTGLGQYQPSAALYGSSAVPRYEAPRPSAVAPPGIAPAGRAPGGLSVQTHHNLTGLPASFSASASTPPPPGLSPPGGVTSSRFTFADYAPAPAPAHVAPAAPAYPAPYAASAAGAAPYGGYGAPAAAQEPKPVGAPAGNYYKSKSGFSVRL